MSEFFDEMFGKKKAIQQATNNETALNQQIRDLKTESSTSSQTSKTEISNLTETAKKLHREIQQLKEELIISKSKSVEATPTVLSSSESAAAEKVLPLKKSSKKLKEASSSTPEDSMENSANSSGDPKN